MVAGQPTFGWQDRLAIYLPSLSKTFLWRMFWGITISRVVVFSAIVSAVAMPLYLAESSPSHGVDDAGITRVMSINLHEYGKYVYTMDSYDEASSSPGLAFLLAAALFFIPAIKLWHLTVVLSILANLLLVWLIYSHVVRYRDKRLASLVALLVSLVPGIAYWATSGLETNIVLLIDASIIVTVARIEEGNKHAYRLLFGLIFFSLLFRTDGFLIPALALVYLGWKCRKDYVILLNLSILSMSVCGSIFLLRRWYFGHWMPTPYYAKIAGTHLMDRLPSGLELFWNMSIESGLFLPCGILILALFMAINDLFKGGKLKSLINFELVFAFAWAGYWFYQGGDFDPPERRLMILFVPGLLVLSKILGQSDILKDKKLWRLTSMILVMAVLIPLKIRYEGLAKMNQTDAWYYVGRFLDQKNPNASVTLDAAGRMAEGLGPGHYVHDMIGVANIKNATAPVNESVPFRVAHVARDVKSGVLASGDDFICSWVTIEKEMPMIGLTPADYESQYQLKYLFKLGVAVDSDPDQVIEKSIQPLDVTEMTEAQIQMQIAHYGYNYGALEKKKGIEKIALSGE